MRDHSAKVWDGMEKKAMEKHELKIDSRTKIFRLLFEGGEYSKRDIILRLGLSLPTVTKCLEDLMAEGLVRKAGTISNTGGRRAAAYTCVATARTAIGLDITRHHVTAVAVDMMGTIIGMLRVQRNFELTDAYSRELAKIVELLIEKYGICRSRVLGVGLGVPGLITKDNRRIFYGEILKFENATVEDFSKYLQYPARLYNDAKAACFAETWLNKGSPNAFYILLSNNVDGAVKINDVLYAGDNLHGCEIGHITIHNNGKPCYCGQLGCVDGYCSAQALYDLSDGDLARFFEMLGEGDPRAVERWDRYTDDLALAVKAVRTLFDCRIILGGYIGGYMDRYIESFKRKVARITTFDKDAEYLDVCRYKIESIAAGAALNFISEFVSRI